MAVKFGKLVEYAILAIPLFFFVLLPLIRPYLEDDSFDDSAVAVSSDKIESLVYPEPGLQCEEHKVNAHVLYKDPLVIYIENFLSPAEADEVIRIR